MTLHIIAHNIRSAENVGSLFRTADSLGVTKLWITGYSPTPEHPKVEKTALGSERTVAWEQATDVVEVIDRLKAEGFRIVGLELDRRSVDLTKFMAPEWTALFLGNEVEGIPPFLLDKCDDVISMTQKGTKESMNVGVAAAIASYWMLNAR